MEYPDNKNNYTIELDLPGLNNLISWATFKAVIDIITGVLSCFGIITAIYGVPMIIAGIRLLNAVEEMKKYMSENNLKNISDSFMKLNEYFKFNGIAIIIKLSFVILMIGLYSMAVFYIISNMPDIFNRFSY